MLFNKSIFVVDAWIRQLEKDYLAGKYATFLKLVEERYQSAHRNDDIEHDIPAEITQLQETPEEINRYQRLMAERDGALAKLTHTKPNLLVSRTINNVINRPPPSCEHETLSPDCCYVWCSVVLCGVANS